MNACSQASPANDLTWEAARAMTGGASIPVTDAARWHELIALPAAEERFSAQALESGMELAALSGPARSALREAMSLLDRRPGLKRFFQAFHNWTYPPGALAAPHQGAWPVLSPDIDPTHGLGYAIALLVGTEEARVWYRRHNLDPALLTVTLRDLGLWIDDYHSNHGVYGLVEFNWLLSHFRCRVFALGRLQFEVTTCRWDMRAYRHRVNGQVQAFAGHGGRARRDGQYDGTNGIHDAQAFDTVFIEDADQVVGTPIMPVGSILAKPVTLSRAEWQPVLRAGDPVLSIHIPATGPLDPDACADAIAQATAFFQQPELRVTYKAFLCDSWLLDPQLETCLEPRDNIVRFLREYYLVPVQGSNEAQTLERVFGGHPDEVGRPDRPSRLQAAVLAAMDNGHRFCRGGGFILPEDLPWGRQFYRAAEQDSGLA